MATIYLHIGTPKTATSSLQIFLAHNAGLLKDHGISYPLFEYHWQYIRSQRNGHFLPAGWIAEPGEPDRTEPDERYYEGLDRLVEEAKTYDKVILSDEEIWYDGQQYPEFWPHLKDDLAARDLDLKVIVYLRRQDLFMQSRWKQHVKEKTVLTFPEFLARADTTDYPLDYNAALQRIADLFGQDSIIVRVFERKQFAGEEHSIYSDFIDIFDLKMSDGFQIKEEINNPALEGNALEIKRIMNGLPNIRPNSKALRQSLFDLPLPDEKTTLFESYEAQQEYCAKFQDSNAAVAREFLGREDGVLFRDSIEDLPPLLFTDHEMLQDEIRAFARTAQTLEERINKLYHKNLEEIPTEACGDSEALRETIATYVSTAEGLEEKANLIDQNVRVEKKRATRAEAKSRAEVDELKKEIQSLQRQIDRLNHSRFIRFEHFCGRILRRITGRNRQTEEASEQSPEA